MPVKERDAGYSQLEGFYSSTSVGGVTLNDLAATSKGVIVGLVTAVALFLSMPAVCDGLKWFERVDVERIDDHVESLAASLLDRLTSRGSGVIVYGPHQMRARGGTITFNVTRGNRIIDYETIESAARERGIAIRGGCFCNPGAAQHAFGIDAARARMCLTRQFTIPRFRRCLGDTPVGALRASIGVATGAGDVERLIALLSALAR
jgi:selenocysteine lyase/cysteine desulfurase